MSITKEKFLIRCRETGLFYHPGVAGPWTFQCNARRFDKSNAVWYAEHLMENRHCVHIVPEGYRPEVETVFERVRNWFAEIYHMFRH